MTTTARRGLSSSTWNKMDETAKDVAITRNRARKAIKIAAWMRVHAANPVEPLDPAAWAHDLAEEHFAPVRNYIANYAGVSNPSLATWAIVEELLDTKEVI